MKHLFAKVLAVALAFSLVAAACGDDDETADTDTEPAVTDTEPAVTDTEPAVTDTEPAVDDTEKIVVDEGEEIQIRSLNAITGDVAFLGIPIQRAVEAAVADYGDIHGFSVSIGNGLDDLCSADGGQAAAQTIVADAQIVGVIGTSCSGAATAASPLISEAGIVMISASNTSPALTSDLKGNAGENYHPGYYRTAHNDLYQGAAMARFVHNKLGLVTAAVIHDGDPYTQGLGKAFSDAFEGIGGTITGFTAVGKEDTDMVPALTELAVNSPEALFFPIFQPAGNHVAEQARTVAGLENTQLLAADGLLNDDFMALSQSEGLYFSGPDVRFGENRNEHTDKTANDFLEDYEANHGETPASPFWGHGYDATAMLLNAIEESSEVNDADQLVIDKAGVRAALTAVRDYSGIIGTINCDDFGDCGSQRIAVIHHTDPADIEAGKANVVFEYAP